MADSHPTNKKRQNESSSSITSTKRKKYNNAIVEEEGSVQEPQNDILSLTSQVNQLHKQIELIEREHEEYKNNKESILEIVTEALKNRRGEATSVLSKTKKKSKSKRKRKSDNKDSSSDQEYQENATTTKVIRKINGNKNQCSNPVTGEWVPNQESWEKKYKELVAYKNKYGHTHVSTSNEKHVPLSLWLGTQKSELHSSSNSLKKYPEIRKERREKLELLGVSFAPRKSNDEVWEENFQAVKEFLDQYGRVPRKNENKLGGWLSSQFLLLRRSSKKSDKRKLQLVEDLLTKRKSLSDIRWDEKFNELKEWKQKHGRLPKKREAGTSVGYWLVAQRNRDLKFPKKKPFDERSRLRKIALFESIGINIPVVDEEESEEED